MFCNRVTTDTQGTNPITSSSLRRTGQNAMNQLARATTETTETSKHDAVVAVRSTTTTTTKRHSLRSYPLPSSLLLNSSNGATPEESNPNTTTTNNNGSGGGIAVLKLNKNLQLQPRRIAFSHDNRTLLITSSRRLLSSTKKGVKSFFKNLSSGVGGGGGGGGGGSSSSGGKRKAIPIRTIDKVLLGPCSPRFLQLIVSAEYYHDVDASDIVQKYQIMMPQQQSSNQLQRLNSQDSSGGGGGGGGGAGTPQSTAGEYNTNNDSLVDGFGSTSSCCCSIIYRSDETQMLETLDIIINDPMEYTMLTESLHDLMELCQAEQTKYTTSLQYIQYHWFEMYSNKNKDGVSSSSIESSIEGGNTMMSCPEFITFMTNHITQIPYTKTVLTELFQEECEKVKLSRIRKVGRSNTNNSNSRRKSRNNNNDNSISSTAMHDSVIERLTLPEVAVLIERVKSMIVQADLDPLQKLWKDLVETDPVPRIGLTPIKNKNKGNKIIKKKKGKEVSGDRDGDADSAAAADGGDDNDAIDDEASLEVSLFYENQDRSISAVAFLSFLRSQQKSYSISLEDATNLIRQINLLTTPEQCWSSSNKGRHDDDESSSSSQSNNKVDVVDRLPKKERGDIHEQPKQPRQQQMLIGGETDRLSKNHFLSWLISDANEILDRTKVQVGSDDMTKPLSYYWINTSHDTYLATPSALLSQSTLPLASFSSSSSTNNYHRIQQHNSSNFGNNIHPTGPEAVDGFMYLAALYRGVRCLEIDVWQDDKNDEPVIARRQVRVSSIFHDSEKGYVIPLSIVLRCIQYYLQENPDTYPIILKLENHITSKLVQQKMGRQFYAYFGKYGLLATSQFENKTGLILDSTSTKLPSPEEARGKIIIIGKRPKKIANVMKVLNDDFDDENDEVFQNVDGNSDAVTDTDDDDDDHDDMHRDSEHSVHCVIGFDTKGPIHSTDPNILVRSPEELLVVAERDAHQAQRDKDEAIAYHRSLLDEVHKYEQLTAEYTQLASMSPMEVKRRAARAAKRLVKDDYEDDDHDGYDTYGSLHQEEKNTKDEGVEIHDVLPSFVERAQDAYAKAAQDAMEAATQQSLAFLDLKEAEKELQRAENDLEMSRQLERTVIENSKKAAAEARANTEGAKSARDRVEEVRELLRSSKDQSSSAGTVVQTALTEAKISEKRAVDAEARAARAMAAAVKDRSRADEETRREEELEQQVSTLHGRCKELTEGVTMARQRLDKANLMYDKLNEQIKLIEQSSQYRMEKEQERQVGEHRYVRHGGSFIAKHEAKFEERLVCRALIKEANEDKVAKEGQLVLLKRQFEELAHQWRNQTDIATQMRKAADRSVMVAEELTEHAEEEREAAKLREIAREKAVAAVEDRGHLRESVGAQLTHAERAAVEASQLAIESRKRADKLASEAEKIQDHHRFVEAVARRCLDYNMAKERYDEAMAKRQEMDSIAKEEKRRLDTNSLMYNATARTASTEHDRARSIQKNEQEAIVAYNKTLLLRKEADSTATKAEIAKSVADAKMMAARHAREYKEKRDMQMEIPIMMAKMTLVHTTKFRNNWNTSLLLSNSSMHSIAHNVLLQMILNANPDGYHQPTIFQAFTQNHLCRVFPSWRSISMKPYTNVDPVLAWSLGCQLVAMNYHCPDETLLVGDGRFRQNGSCGYALKPPSLISSSSHSNPARGHHHVSTKPSVKETWSFCVLGAYHLPKVDSSHGTNNKNDKKAVTRPFVKLSLYEGSADGLRVVHTTKPATTINNCLNPVWDPKEVFSFTVQNPSIAMLSFTVWDTFCVDDDIGSLHNNNDTSSHHQQNSRHQNDSKNNNNNVFIAGSAVPVSCLQEGYRSVSLFDANHSKGGPYAYASLLVKVSCNK